MERSSGLIHSTLPKWDKRNRPSFEMAAVVFKPRISRLNAGLYRIWCGVNRLGDSGVHTLGDTSALVNLAGQLLLTRRGKTRMDGIDIVFEFYIQV